MSIFRSILFFKFFIIIILVKTLAKYFFLYTFENFELSLLVKLMSRSYVHMTEHPLGFSSLNIESFIFMYVGGGGGGPCELY